MPIIQQTSKTNTLLRSTDAAAELDNNWFDAEYWQQKDAITGSSRGRSATHFINTGSQQLALRHYNRGGLIRHIMKDNYLYTGLQNTRVYQELAILEQMQKWELPAPTPIAGRVLRKGLYYKADILMARIPNAVDIYQKLQKSTLATSLWQRMGATIAQFHACGLYHADLNCHNLMIDDSNKIWMIDFDRASLQPANAGRGGWQAQNLGRLYRSFAKEKTKSAQFHFTEQNWEQLLKGYDSSSS